MSVAQCPSISNIQSHIDQASSHLSQENAESAMHCLFSASSELTMLQKEMQNLSTSLENLVGKANEVYEKKRALATGTATAKGIFPLRVFYQVKRGETIELCGEEKAGLSWRQGKALTCYGNNKWKLDFETDGSFEYKLVLHKADGTIVFEKRDLNRRYCMAPVDLVPKFPIFKDSDPGFILVDDKDLDVRIS